jgi:hypothetical protein
MINDILLNGKPYRIDIKSWKVRDIIDFAPRASVPGGSVVMSDLSLYQPLVQSDWRRGFGFHWYQDAAGYMKTFGDMDTRHDGIIMRYTKEVSSDTNNNIKRGFTLFNGRVYSWGDGGLRYYDGNSWNAHQFSGIEEGHVTQASAGSTTSLTFKHTIPSYGQNKLIIVAISLESNVTVSSVTFNGDALTMLASAGTAPKAQLWYRLAPDSVTGNVVITLGSASPIAASASGFLYVDQTTPFSTNNSSTGTGTSASVSLAGGSGRKGVVVLAKDGGEADGAEAGANQSQTWIQYVSTTLTGGGSIRDNGSTVLHSWSWVNSRDYALLGAVLSPATQEATGTINYALSAGEYLFYCPDGGRIRKISTSFVDSEAGLSSTSADYKWLAIHNGFIYAGKDGTNRVHYSTEVDLSDLEGTEDDPNVIYVGLGNTPTLGAISYAGNLYVTRRDGIYTIGEDAIARIAVNYYQEAADVNFKSMAMLAGFLMYPIRNRFIQWNGVRVNTLTPDRLSSDFPYVTYGTFNNFVATDDFLYLTARTSEDPYNEHLLCFDGTGWHKLKDLATGPDESITAMGYESANNRLWYHKSDDGTNTTYYIQMQENSLYPYASFNTSGSHGLYTSLMDMGFRRVKKSMPSLIIEAENLTSSRYISVYYQLDGEGDWILWNSVKTNGTTELTHPGSRFTREFNYVQFRFDFVTDSSEQSPILNGYTVRFLMRPDVMFGWNFNITAASDGLTEMGVVEERTSADIVRELRELRDSKSPVEFIDVLGERNQVYLTALTETPQYRKDNREGEVSDIEYSINVNLVSMEFTNASSS